MNIDHALKIKPQYFKAVMDGSKTFEVRSISDRYFEQGDRVWLLEFDKDHYTGEYLVADIGFVLTYYDHEGIKPGYVVFSVMTHEWWPKLTPPEFDQLRELNGNPQKRTEEARK